VSTFSAWIVLSGIWSISSLMMAIVLSIAFRRTVGPNPSAGCELGSWPIRSRVSRKRANAHSLSVPPTTPRYHLSASRPPRRLLMCFQPPKPPLCIHIKLPCVKGWQLSSLREPSVVARTWAKMRCDAVLEAIRCRFVQFQAGMVDVNKQGAAPSLGSG
jgi:hypothetical protein